MGWSAYDRQHTFMKSNLPLTRKRKIYEEGILPVLTHGSET